MNKSTLSYIGATMAVLGLLAIVLNFLDRVPRLLIWIYNWGEGTAWVIKILFVVIGATLYFMAKRGGEAAQEEKQES
jgi:hypothetical protein